MERVNGIEPSFQFLGQNRQFRMVRRKPDLLSPRLFIQKGSQGSQAAPISSFRIVGFPSTNTTATQGVSGEVILPDHSTVSTIPGFKINSLCASGTVRFSV